MLVRYMQTVSDNTALSNFNYKASANNMIMNFSGKSILLNYDEKESTPSNLQL